MEKNKEEQRKLEKINYSKHMFWHEPIKQNLIEKLLQKIYDLEDEFLILKTKQMDNQYKKSCLTEVYRDGIRKGKQEQQEVSYTEEEVLKIIDSLFHHYANSFTIDAKEYFLQQFKKVNYE